MQRHSNAPFKLIAHIFKFKIQNEMPEISEEIKMQRYNNSLIFNVLFQESNINSIKPFCFN